MNMDWVKTSESRPNCEGQYLVYVEGDAPNIWLVWYYAHSGIWSYLPSGVEEPTYWMPLPGPP